MNSTSKFNVGDKVRVVAPTYLGLKRFIGKQLVVRKVVGDLEGGNVYFEGFDDSFKDSVLGDYLELVESATPKLTKKRRIEALEKDVARQETELEELRAKIEAFEQKAKLVEWGMQKATSSYDNPSAAGIIASLHGGEIVEVDGQPMFVKTSLTPNQRRARFIADAKGFVEQTIEDSKRPYEESFYIRVPHTSGGGAWASREIKFEVNTEKRTVVALAIGYANGKVCEKAIAKCAPDDVFNADIGKAIAVGRLFGLDVERFINAPKSTEAVVGQRVTLREDHDFYGNLPENGYVVGKIEDGIAYDADTSDGEGWIPTGLLKILDDTEAQYV